MVGLFGDGLVDDVLFCCCGDSLEEDLRWGPRLGDFVILVVFDDDVTNLKNSKVYPSELFSVQDQTSIVSKPNTENFNHLLTVKYT